jgi:hypothetical protein
MELKGFERFVDLWRNSFEGTCAAISEETYPKACRAIPGRSVTVCHGRSAYIDTHPGSIYPRRFT